MVPRIIALAVLVTAGLVPGVAQAGNPDFCAVEQVCLYDGNNWVGFLESRPPGQRVLDTWPWAEDHMDSWENRTGKPAAWYHDRDGKGRCVNMAPGLVEDRRVMSTPPLLSVEGAGRRYVTGAETVWAVREASFEAHAGEFVAVFGASGSGKSTLVNLLAGLDVPDDGTVWIGQADVGALDEDARARLRLGTVGVVFQDHNLVEEFSAAENVALPLEVRGWTYRDALREAEVHLDRVGLAGLGGRLPSQLSGGQRQRVGIARALVGDRRVLLADEPTGALDSANSRALFELIRALCDDGTLAVVCSHDLMVRRFADTVYEMVDGQVLRRAPATEGTS
jgi:putative ABC transport system ATP-binding protein